MPRQFLALLIIAGTALPALAQTYTVDPTHSHITWAVSRLDASSFRGKLVRNTGKVVLDASAGKGQVDILIDIRAQVAGNELDKNLMMPSLFNAAQFPTASFKSSKVTFNGPAPASVDGDDPARRHAACDADGCAVRLRGESLRPQSLLWRGRHRHHQAQRVGDDILEAIRG